MAVAIKQHNWVRMNFIPVELVGFFLDKGPAVIDSNDEHEAITCLNCGEPCTPETAGQECEADA